ncbi:preprotein translocase subunit YajC [Thiohalobacter sp. IOR34]|nr:preprotein translocase subunit YajC [Thiohalobacter sp. IOR34]WJW76837.1 preprotein translocase subunit YajC [Thiohalobacter sp. IOR34]
MNFFISAARAEGPAGAGPQQDPLMSFLPLIVIFVVFWFLLIRPQQKKVKEHKAMVEALKKGDEVITNGGLLGKITEVGENYVQLKLADNIEVKVQRHAIASLVPKGSMKEL